MEDKELMQTFKKKDKEAKQLKQKINLNRLSKKTSCIPALILQNERLSKIILQLPGDEFKVVFREVIADEGFTALIEEIIQSSSSLGDLRESKSAKAERRKQKALTAVQSALPGKECTEQNNGIIQN